MTQLVQQAASDWLSLRRPADERARECSASLLVRLNDYFSSTHEAAPNFPISGEALVYDLGAGSGANLAWLAPRLMFLQQWTLIDLDSELLQLAPNVGGVSRVAAVRKLEASIDVLDTIFDGSTGRAMVTCSAVLDILSRGQIQSLCSFMTAQGIAALFSLNVTGDVQMTPGHELDAEVEAAFNAHQQRAGLAGPQAGSLAANLLSEAGFEVHVEDTPWVLGPDDPALVQRYLTDRVSVAAEHDPTLNQPARIWLADRLGQLREGVLRVQVGHQDLLALPSS